MFQIHKKPQGDAAVKRSVQKILDPKKDIVTRLKHLKIVLEHVTEPADIQTIYEQYYSHIYHIFFENFLLVEACVRQKGAHRAQREELESILQIFESILLTLPDMIHQRWQYNSIDHIIKKLIHPGNSLKMRKEGMRFFLLWFRSLQANAREATMLLYACLVPGFPPPLTEDKRYAKSTLESLLHPTPENQTAVSPSEISCLIPPLAGEKNPPDLTKIFLDNMLEYMVVESYRLQWKDSDTMHTQSFSFLWDMFKRCYLPHIFTDFRFEMSVYQPDLSLPEPREPVNYVLNVTDTGTIDPCIEVAAGFPMLPARVSTIKWVVAFTSHVADKSKFKGGRYDIILDGLPRLLQRHLHQQQHIVTSVIGMTEKNNMDNDSKSPIPTSKSLGLQEAEESHSNTSTLTEKAPSLTSLSSLDDKLRSNSSELEEKLVRKVLYSTRSNVNIVHEIFRQAFILPFTESATMSRVVKVYQEWIQDSNVPVFMEDPDLNVTDNRFNEDETLEDVNEIESSPSVRRRNGFKKSKASSTNTRNISYMRGQLNPMIDDASYVRTGCQTTYQLFVTNSAHVFLVEPPSDASGLIHAQVDVCKRVLNLYRHMVMNIVMDSTTWTQLLQVLLHITRIMLQDTVVPQSIRATTVAGRLASPVFQTLIVSWIKANLFVHVSRELWDELVDVLSSLMHWKDLIVEWAKNMETMTRVLARHVYSLELSDLPLDKIPKKGKAGKERFGKIVRNDEQSFSRGWSGESRQVQATGAQANKKLRRDRSQSEMHAVIGIRVSESKGPSNELTLPGEDAGNFSQARLQNGTRMRAKTALGIESPPDMESPRNSVLGDLPEYPKHIPLKRGFSDNSNLSLSPPTEHLLGKSDNIQRSSSTSDIASDVNNENTPDELHNNRIQSLRHRSNSGPGYNNGTPPPETVHGLKVTKDEDDGITSLSSVEDTFNDMFDELIQQRLANQKTPTCNKAADVVSLKSQDSASIDPNWNPWGDPEQRDSNSDELGEGDVPSLMTDKQGYSSLREDEANGWGTCLEDSQNGTLPPPNLTEQQLIDCRNDLPLNERVSMLSKEQNSSSETNSPGVSSPPYQIYKHPSRDRYDSTAMLLPGSQPDLLAVGNREGTLHEGDEREGSNDSPSETMLEKSSDDILNVHCSTPQLDIDCLGGMSGDEGSFEESTAMPDKTDSLLAPSDDCSILAGGKRTGWYSDVAVALWRRLLGILGDVNTVIDPVIHQLIFTYLLKIWKVLYNMRQNLGITVDNASTPEPPELVPPLRIMAPWAFKAAMSLPDTHKGGRLHAYQLLSNMTLQNHDTRLEPEHLALYYLALHDGLHSTDQDTVNEIVESSSPKFFSCNLPASSLLLLDFIYGCHSVAASNDLSGPRIHAQTILGSILCFPNLYYDLPLLNPDSKDPQAYVCNNIKEYVSDALLTSAKKEPSAPARCVALSSLGVWLYEELTAPADEITASHSPTESSTDSNLSPVKGRHLARHGRVKEAINVLLVSLKFSNRMVAGIACSQLHLLTHCIPQLLEYMPEIPARIVEVMSLTASALLQNSDAKSSDTGRQLLVSLLFCICDWCMLLPLHMLIETTSPGSDKRLIRTVFKALQTGALGKPGHSAKHSYSLSDLASKDFDPNLQLDKVQEGSWPVTPGGNGRNGKLTLPPMPNTMIGTDNIVSLTASTVLSHLTNHLGHFPFVQGPAVLDSLVTEQQDHIKNVKSLSPDLSPDLFNCPNVQFLIYNDTCLLSVVEIPVQNDDDDENTKKGPTAGLSSAPTELRVIIRDTSGKFCWDSSLLYGPSDIRSQTKPVSYVPLSTLYKEIARAVSEHCHNFISYVESERDCKQRVKPISLPLHNHSPTKDQATDKLDQLLQYVGWSSPECQYSPGRPLNIAAGTPQGLEENKLQGKALEYIIMQHKSQSDNYSANAHHRSFQCNPAHPLEYSPPQSPFHQARLLISEAGFLSRENRRRVNLLRKNERLLLELKNLDSTPCRETHKVAVLYIALGQEDKLSVLSNTAASEDFENFVSGLGWEVDLKTHCGFRGKLQSDGKTGTTAPYYATSTLEVVFHVSTRFPSTDVDSRNVKLKHLGNDEVHIVWSEHTREYRRGIIPTEFGDVVIIIYPIRHRLYRIQIMKKDEVPYFGPLFDGAIVNARVLPILVRETAINAGRAKRSQLSMFQPFYKERARYLKKIIEDYKSDTTFEDYASQLFCPAPAKTSSPSSKSRGSIPKFSQPTLPDSSGTGTSSNTTPTSGKVSSQSVQQTTGFVGGNSNINNNNRNLKHEHNLHTGKSHQPESTFRSIASKTNDARQVEMSEGAQQSSSTNFTTIQTHLSLPQHHPGAKTDTNHPPTLISTPRPKPSFHATNSQLYSSNFVSSKSTHAPSTPHPSSSRIHIPVSKIQSSAFKVPGNSSSVAPAKKTSMPLLKNTSSTSIIPPPLTHHLSHLGTRSTNHAMVRSNITPVTSPQGEHSPSAIKKSSHFPYQNIAK